MYDIDKHNIVQDALDITYKIIISQWVLRIIRMIKMLMAYYNYQ